MWTWMRTDFLRAMFGVSSWYNNGSTNLKNNILDYSSVLVGRSVLIRQARVKNGRFLNLRSKYRVFFSFSRTLNSNKILN